MKRKRWAEALVFWSRKGSVWFAAIADSRSWVFYRHYKHRRSARRAAIQWAKRNGYSLRWV